VPAVDPRLEQLRRDLASAGSRLFSGVGAGGLCFADPEQAVLVLGPPNVLAAPGPVVATSTKLDVVAATVAVRSGMGRCWLLDPTGTVDPPPGVVPLRWSPVRSARRWDDAVLTARVMVGAARPAGRHGEAAHWSERAEAVLAPVLHAAALSGSDMRTVSSWVLRHDHATPRALLSGHGAGLGADVLAGIAATDSREQSGIWSTAAGVLAAYRSEAALAAAAGADFDAGGLAATTDTVYVCAPARHQDLVAPVIVAFLETVRAGAYDLAAADARRGGQRRPALTLALDELANIAPLPDLPAMVSEAGGQNVLTMACLQDLSQARSRWGAAADGFLSLFGTKVVLPGVADLATLELVSRLGGEIDVPVRSVTRAPWWSGRASASESWSQHRQRRLPVDAVNQLPAGSALVLSGGRPPGRVALRPWWGVAPFAPVVADRRRGPAGAGLPPPGPRWR
jgi:type IV secretion system protein VirD4